MVKKDWLKEAEKLYKRVDSLSKRYLQLRFQLKTKSTNNPRVFKLVPKTKALRCWKVQKELEKLDSVGLIRYLIAIPFEETVIVLQTPKKSQKKVKNLLQEMRQGDRLRIIAFAIRAGWIKPLRK